MKKMIEEYKKGFNNELEKPNEAHDFKNKTNNALRFLIIYLGLLWILSMYSMIYKKTGVSNNFLFDVYTTAIVGGMFIMVLEMGFFTVQRREKLVNVVICIIFYILCLPVYLLLKSLIYLLKRNGLVASSNNIISSLVILCVDLTGCALLLIGTQLLLPINNTVVIFVFVVVMYILIILFDNYIEKKLYIGNEDGHYQYKQEMKYLDAIYIIIGTATCSLLDKMSGEEKYIPILFLIVFFVGIESLRKISSYEEKKRLAFVKCIYENLRYINGNVVPQIKERHDAMKIRIRLPIVKYQIPYEKQNCINLAELERKEEVKEKLDGIFDNLIKFLSEEYAVYENEEWERFMKDLNNNLNNMAYLLNNL